MAVWLSDVFQDDLKELAATDLPWPLLGGRRVLVTGATGLVGGYLVEVLARHHRFTGTEPTELVVVGRHGAALRRRFGHLPATQVTVVESDLGAELTVAGPVDYLIHAASPATPTDFAIDPVGSYGPNVLGTHYLLALAAAKATGAVVFLSSGAAQGPHTTGAGVPLNESSFAAFDPLEPYSVYAESKRMGETICMAWWRQHHLPVTMIRLGHTYGPGLRGNDSRSFAQFVHAALEGKDIVLHSDGRARRDLCYLADATVGILLGLLRGERGSAYLLANTKASLTIGELASLVAALAPAPGIAVRYDLAAVPVAYSSQVSPYWCPDTSRLESLGWRPSVDPAEGFRRTLLAHASL